MKKIIFLFFVTTIYSIFAVKPDTLYVLNTTDVHGNILSYDYFYDKPTSGGLARVYTKVCEYRKKHKNVILLDNGDMLQGTPLSYYFSKFDKLDINPMILIMNYMKYDAFTVGNHDKSFDESGVAAQIATEFGTEHHEVFIGQEDVLKNLGFR